METQKQVRIGASGSDLTTRTVPEGAQWVCPPYGHLRPEILHSAEFGDEAQVRLPHLALVILEKPQCPSEEGGEMGCSIMLEPPSSPSTPLPVLGEVVHGQTSHTCSAGGACPGSLPGAALAAEPSAGVAPVASAEEGEPCDHPSREFAAPQLPPTGHPESWQACLCSAAFPAHRASTHLLPCSHPDHHRLCWAASGP